MSADELRDLLQLAREAALAAGAYLRESVPSAAVQTGHDIKLEQDREAEAIVLERLGPSGLGALCEERGGEVDESAPHWVVDPLDGTYNYYRGLPECAVAIALRCNGGDGESGSRDSDAGGGNHGEGRNGREDGTRGSALLGVIYDFSNDHLYSGAPGLGAWMNDAPMRVSAETQPQRALLATGFPAGTDFSPDAIASRSRCWSGFCKVRMTGSAALATARVAQGVYDAYLEYDIRPWDVYAGLALIEAAGGAFLVRPSQRGALNVIATASPELTAHLAGFQ